MKAHPRTQLLFAINLAAVLLGCGGNAPPPPINVSILSSPQSVDEGQAATITATVSNDNSSKGVIWSVSCAGSACGKVTGQTATTATYTAPNPLATAMSVQLTATSVADASKSALSTLSVVPPPSVTTTSLPGATGGSSYNAVLQESGGIAPLTWTVTAGSLPPGLSLGADGTISGTPMAGGAANFSVQAADSGSPPLTSSANLSINVVVLPLSITTTTLPDGTVDTAYKQQFLATGGIPPYNWTVSSGLLPSWSVLDPSSGIVSGIPPTTGTDNFTVQVADSQTTAASASQPLSITTVTAESANNSELNGNYAFLFTGFDDASGTQVALVGSFLADGKGKITAGIEDENNPSGSMLGVAFAGTYNIGSDNRGAFTIVTANGLRTYSLVLNSISNEIARQARFVEFDDSNGTNGRRGSGVFRQQDVTAFSQSKISGPYAFGFEGQDATGNREAMAGSFHADGSGLISSGVADLNIAGNTTNPTLTGNYAVPTAASGRTAITLNLQGSASVHMSGYLVSAVELLVMTTDSIPSEGLMSGTILSQSSTSFQNNSLNAPAVYYQLGVNPSAQPAQSVAEVGLLVPDGNGKLSVELDDQNGGASAKDQTFTTTYSVQPTGRVTIGSWRGDASSPPRLLYLVDLNKAFFLDTSTSGGFGFVEGQSGVPAGGFSNGSFSGAFSAATISPSVSGNLNGTGQATLDGAGSFSQLTNASTTAGWFVDQNIEGTYSIKVQGRGTVTSLNISTAGIASSKPTIVLLLAVLFGCFRARRHKSRIAMFCFAVWIATTPAGCPRFGFTNQLVFYMVSPTKAVMINEQTSDRTPEITIIEQ